MENAVSREDDCPGRPARPGRRTRSLRTRVAALLLVPLLSLVALWGYAAAVTGRDALDHRRYLKLGRAFAPGGQDLLVRLGEERLASAAFLGGPRAPVPAELAARRARLDAAVARFRRDATSPATRGLTDAEMERRVADVLGALGGLGHLRAEVDGHAADRLAVVTGYGAVVDAMHRLYDALIVIDDAPLYDRMLATRAAGRAMELMQREDALVAGALAGQGRMSPAEHRAFVEMVGEQRGQWTRQRALLDPRVYAAGARQVFESPRYLAFRALEDRVADRVRGPLPVRAAEWRAAAEPVISSVDAMILDDARRAGLRADALGRAAYVRLGAVGGAGLLAILVSVLLSLRFARGFVRELVGLRSAAEELADRRLPGVVERLRRNERVDAAAEAPPLRPGRTAEVARLAEAITKVRRTAVDAAVGQAELRAGAGRLFLNIARRNQTLLHRQLTMLDGLESRAGSDDLADLFRIDHLTTRMRRHAESLIVLAGATPGRGWRRPVRVVDVLHAAVAEIEDYPRVSVLTQAGEGLAAAAVTDVVHLLAELLENAAVFSPPNTEVRMLAERVGAGFVVEIEDRGLGVGAELLADANRRLAEPPGFDLVDTDRLGLFVVGRLAARHGVSVSLQRSPYGGVTAVVLLPSELIVPAEKMDEIEAEADAAQGGDDREPGPDARPDAADAPPARPGLVPRPRGETVVPLRERTPTGRLTARPMPAERLRPAAPWGAPEEPPADGGQGGAPRRPYVNPWSDDAVSARDTDEPCPGATRPGRKGAGTAAEPSAGVPHRAETAGRAGPAGSAGTAGSAHSAGTAGTSGGGRAAGARARLPRRVRQENLAPQLREAPADVPESGLARSPEEARALLASIQRGWRRGLASPIGDEDVDEEGR